MSILTHCDDTVSITSFRNYQYFGSVLFFFTSGGDYMRGRVVITYNIILLYFISFSVSIS